MEVIQTGSINTIQVKSQNEAHVNCLSLSFYELLIMKILLLGAKGQLGIELQKVLPELGEVIALSRNELDLSNQIALSQKLSLIKPDLIVNASAYTSVDKAEIEKDLAMLINASVPDVLAKYSAKNNSILVHYSTDYVFDGQKTTPYAETDEPNPISVYGLSKLSGERKISKSNCKNLIFRTSWLFSMHGQNFLTTILKLSKEKDELKIINDQWGSPTSCKWLAATTLICLKHCINKEIAGHSVPWGLYHASSKGITNWFEYTKKIISIAINLGEILKIDLSKIYPIKSALYKQIAKRPLFSGLSTDLIRKTFLLEIDNFESYISKEMCQLNKQNTYN